MKLLQRKKSRGLLVGPMTILPRSIATPTGGESCTAGESDCDWWTRGGGAVYCRGCDCDSELSQTWQRRERKERAKRPLGCRAFHRLYNLFQRDVTFSCTRSLNFLTFTISSERNRTWKAGKTTRICQIQTIARCTCARGLLRPVPCLPRLFLLCLTRVVRTPFSQFARLVRSSSSVSSKSTRTGRTVVSTFKRVGLSMPVH